MTNKLKKLVLSVPLTCAAIALGFPDGTIKGQSANAQTGSQDKPVEQARKNIQVLKGLPESQLFIVMNYVRASLGVTCAYCHVNNGGDKWEWEKDDKPAKKTARKMMQMVFDINKNSFEGRHAVSCYTCHRASTEPTSAPLLPQMPPEGGPAGLKTPATLPTLDQVLDKFVQALRGKSAVEKTKTRVSKGSQISWNGSSMPVEIVQQAPYKILTTLTMSSQVVIARGFDGSTGWMKGPRGQRELTGDDLDQMKRTADFFWMLKIRDVAKDMFVMGKEKIGDREVYVVGAMVGTTRIDKFYFDTQTGLLIRSQILKDTLIGWIPEQTDYDDYKEVDGVKVPFTIRQSYVDPWIGWTRKFTEIKFNVPIDETKFNMPK
jgi:hypothetical protein